MEQNVENEQVAEKEVPPNSQPVCYKYLNQRLTVPRSPCWASRCRSRSVDYPTQEGEQAEVEELKCTKVSKTRLRSMSASGAYDSEALKARVEEWRAKRKANLVSHMMKQRPVQKSFSSAVLGILACSDLTAPSTSNVPCPSSSGDSKTVDRSAIYLTVPYSPILEESPSKMESPAKPPNTVPRMRKSMAPTSEFSPKPVEIRKRLSDWLEKRGNSLDSFHHLQCFGLKAMAKDRLSLPMPLKSMNSDCPSTQNLNDNVTLSSSDSTILESESTVTSDTAVPSTPDEVFKDCFNEEDKENEEPGLFLPETLKDLQQLIKCGYPHDQCEEWLALIRRVNCGITDAPLYWECFAALKEARGEFSSAIDGYGHAVMRGAETNQIEASLEQLWDKFSALNIALPPNKPRTCRRATLDPKQIFTTSIIKFALQKKAVKLSSNLGTGASSLKYFVTPVRRTTRKSTCRFGSTSPDFRNIGEMDPAIVRAMTFRSNAALEPTL